MNKFLLFTFYLIIYFLINIQTAYSIDDYISESYKIIEYKVVYDEVKGSRIIDPLGNEFSTYNSDIYLLDYKDDKIVYAFKNKLWLVDENINIIDLNITIYAPYLAKFDDNANRLLFICSILTPTVKSDICIYDIDDKNIVKITERGDIVSVDWLNDTAIIYPIDNTFHILNLRDNRTSIIDANNPSEIYASSDDKILYASWFERTKYYHILDLETYDDIIVSSTSSIRAPFGIRIISWGLDGEHIIYEHNYEGMNRLVLAKLNYEFNDDSKVLVNNTYYTNPEDIIDKEIILMQNYTFNNLVIDPEDSSAIAIEEDDNGIYMYKVKFGITLPEFEYVLPILSILIPLIILIDYIRKSLFNKSTSFC